MKRLLAVTSIVLFGFTLTFGQDAAELSVIRALLGVPSNTPVVSSRTAPLPVNKPLKVYVDVSGDSPERDKVVKDDIVQWLDAWNQRVGGQEASLEITTDSVEANVALIHFTDFPYAMDFVEGSASSQADINPRTGQPDNAVLVSNSLRMTMIVFTYIIVREPKTLRILYRRKDPILSKTTYLANPTRSKEATATVRKEIEKEINKRKAKAQEGKGQKSPETRLRDEFTALLTAGGVAVGKE